MPGPAATISHMHTCPMASGTTPHVGGPIIGPGVPTVLIGGKPAATMGDQCTCAGPPDVIVEGVSTVLIGGKPAATMGSKTAHGGLITAGEPTVLIGTGSSAPTAIMAVNKIPFPKITLKDRVLSSLSGNSLKEAEEKQEKIKEEAKNTEGEPKIYGLEWYFEDKRTSSHNVFKEVTVRAQVLNIVDGESITFSIKRPTETTNEQGNITKNEEDVIELTGTVQDKMVEVTWEIEKAPEQQNKGNAS